MTDEETPCHERDAIEDRLEEEAEELRKEDEE